MKLNSVLVSILLSTDINLAIGVLNSAVFCTGQTNPSIARLQYGKAVEGLVAQDIRKSPILRYLYEYTGRRPSSPDFVGQHIFSGLNFDITTDTARSISEHLARPYGPGLVFSTYIRPSWFKVFP